MMRFCGRSRRLRNSPKGTSTNSVGNRNMTHSVGNRNMTHSVGNRNMTHSVGNRNMTHSVGNRNMTHSVGNRNMTHSLSIVSKSYLQTLLDDAGNLSKMLKTSSFFFSPSLSQIGC